MFGLRNRSLVSLLIKEKSLRVHFLHPFARRSSLTKASFHSLPCSHVWELFLYFASFFCRTITADYGYFLLISMATFYSLCFFFSAGQSPLTMATSSASTSGTSSVLSRPATKATATTTILRYFQSTPIIQEQTTKTQRDIKQKKVYSPKGKIRQKQKDKET